MLNSPILPEDTNAAMRKMIALSQELVKAYEYESNAIAMGWDLEFLQASEKKQALGGIYQQASKEFLDRTDEFKRADGSLIDQLTDMQSSLKFEARTNMTILSPVLQKLQDTQKPVSAS